MSYISETEAVVLNAARKVLDDMTERRHTSYADGRVAEACEMAESALFNVFNVLKNVANDAVADKHIHQKRVATIPVLTPVTEMPVSINRDAWK